MIPSGATETAEAPEAAEPTPVRTAPPKKGHRYKLVKRRGRTYCLNEKGKKIRGRFCKVRGRTRYFDKKGAMVRGWLKKGKDYYYLSRNHGNRVKNRRIDGVRIRNGRAVVTAENRKKLDTMLTAAKIVKKITRPTDTKSQKLYKCYRYVMKFGYRRYRLLKPIYRQKGWEATFANDIFEKHSGCCVSEASALAFLTRECGYKDVYVCHDTSHAWMELKGRVYDVLFSESKGFSEYYGRSYKGYGCHPVGKRKIG